MSKRIFNTELTIERHTGGSRNPVTKRYEDNEPEIITGMFSVQPFQKGSDQVILPDGIRSSDAYVLYGKTFIQEADQFAELKADKTIINNRSYIAFNVANWSFHGSNADHYESVFVREDKISQRTN
jgi:hypothetical protein